MIANAEQIGLEKGVKKREYGGEETDGIVGLVPTIPAHDGAKKPLLSQSNTCCCHC